MVGTVILELVSARDHLEIVKMADQLWKSMPAALKRPTLDELYRRLRDLDYTQVDERMAVMLNAILQLEEQGECRESATEAREKNKANLDRDSAKLERDHANLERDQAILERDQARHYLDMLKAEYQQEQRVREIEANCEQLKSELEKIQRRQREFDRQKEKGTRTTERAAAGSRPESRMEVEEAPRSKGRFNLNRAAQEHIKEGLEVWISTESVSSLRGLETELIRPLMDVALPGYTPSSTPTAVR